MSESGGPPPTEKRGQRVKRERHVEGDRRAISTVADVSIAILLVVASIAVLAPSLDTPEGDSQPTAAAQTADTLGASTLTLSYQLDAALESADSDLVGDTDRYSEASLTGTSHAPVLGHLARATLFSLTPGGCRVETPELLPVLGTEFQRTLDERLQAELVDSSFETSVTAIWRPFEGSSFHGSVTVGQQPPPGVDTSLVTMSVPAEFPSIRTEAVAAVERGGGYDTVASIAAGGVVEGLFPLPATQRRLEGDGVERELAVLKYLRLTGFVDTDTQDGPSVTDSLSRAAADARALNDYLRDRLARQFETTLEATFETADSAANAVSTGEISVSVITWEP